MLLEVISKHLESNTSLHICVARACSWGWRWGWEWGAGGIVLAHSVLAKRSAPEPHTFQCLLRIPTMAEVNIHLYDMNGFVTTLLIHDPDNTRLWDVKRYISTWLGVAGRDQHLVLGVWLPPPVLTIRSILPRHGFINLTLVMSPRTCAVCGQFRPGHACRKCLGEYYCSQECAVVAWPHHRGKCREERNRNWTMLYERYIDESTLRL